MDTEKKSIIKWVRTHKKQLAISGISIIAMVSVILGIQNKDTLAKLRDALHEVIKEGTKYSARWFRNVADVELKEERERVRLEYCTSGGELRKALSLERLLSLFDAEKSRRDWSKETPHVTSIPREHGRYLMNDE